MCELCRGQGRIEVPGCPRRALTEEACEFVESHALLAEHKTWPVAGGTQDQAAVFLAAVSSIDADIAVIKAHAARAAGIR